MQSVSVQTTASAEPSARGSASPTPCDVRTEWPRLSSPAFSPARCAYEAIESLGSTPRMSSRCGPRPRGGPIAGGTRAASGCASVWRGRRWLRVRMAWQRTCIEGRVRKRSHPKFDDDCISRRELVKELVKQSALRRRYRRLILAHTSRHALGERGVSERVTRHVVGARQLCRRRAQRRKRIGRRGKCRTAQSAAAAEQRSAPDRTSAVARRRARTTARWRDGVRITARRRAGLQRAGDRAR